MVKLSHVLKFNLNHDARGRFAHASGAPAPRPSAIERQRKIIANNQAMRHIDDQLSDMHHRGLVHISPDGQGISPNGNQEAEKLIQQRAGLNIERLGFGLHSKPYRVPKPTIVPPVETQKPNNKEVDTEKDKAELLNSTANANAIAEVDRQLNEMRKEGNWSPTHHANILASNLLKKRGKLNNARAAMGLPEIDFVPVRDEGLTTLKEKNLRILQNQDELQSVDDKLNKLNNWNGTDADNLLKRRAHLLAEGESLGLPRKAFTVHITGVSPTEEINLRKRALGQKPKAPVTFTKQTTEQLSIPFAAPEGANPIEYKLAKMPVSSMKRLGGGVTVTKKVTLQDGSLAVWKPDSGEYQGRDAIRVGYQSQREVAAYELSKVVGMDDLTTPVVRRQIKGEWGSLMKWNSDGTLARDTESDRKYDGDLDAGRTAMFDFVIGNTDRHASNWLVNDSDKLELIDHSLCFPDNPSGKFGYSGNHLMTKHAAALERAGRAPEYEKIAQPYIDKKTEILSTLHKVGLSEDAIKGVENRIDGLKGGSWQYLNSDDHWETGTGTVVRPNEGNRNPIKDPWATELPPLSGGTKITDSPVETVAASPKTSATHTPTAVGSMGLQPATVKPSIAETARQLAHFQQEKIRQGDSPSQAKSTTAAARVLQGVAHSAANLGERTRGTRAILNNWKNMEMQNQLHNLKKRPSKVEQVKYINNFLKPTEVDTSVEEERVWNDLADEGKLTGNRRNLSQILSGWFDNQKKIPKTPNGGDAR